MDPKHVTALNRIAEDDTYGSPSAAEHDKYNIDTPKVYSGPAADDAEVIGGIFKSDSAWKDIHFIMKDPEPEVDVADYWMRGNRNLDRNNEATVSLPYLCRKCRIEDHQDLHELQFQLLVRAEYDVHH